MMALTRQNEYLEPISLRNFIIAILHYAEINHSDWILQVTKTSLTNQSALFQHRVVMPH